MNINYFFRHPEIGFSIHRVFRTLIVELNNKVKIKIYEVPCKRSMPWHILKNNIYVFNKRKKNTINHITGHIHDVLPALIGTKTVLTVHDLVFLDNVKNPIKRFYKWLFWLYLPVKISDEVVCISNQTKQNILKYIQTNKLSVIYNPVDPIFKFQEKSFNSKKPIILHIGTGWNKNLDLSIMALKGISCHLRIIGKLNSSQLQLLDENHIEYSNQSNLSDIEIKEEYAKCDIVNFPSLYEGFGMPIIEGQQTGRIVITSKIEPILEVAGEAAVFVNPEDVDSLKQGYLKIIEDDIYRNQIIKQGLHNAKRFSVQHIAQQYQKLYQKLLKT